MLIQTMSASRSLPLYSVPWQTSARLGEDSERTAPHSS